jgi:hypothetical protein
MPDLPPEIAELLARVDELDAFELDARLRRAVALEQRFEAWAGPLLVAAVEGRLHRDLGFTTLEGYARDALGNRTTLCAAHHLRGVHAGRIRITGEAPDRLRFELGLRPGVAPLEVWGSGEVRGLPMQEVRPEPEEARRTA